MLVHHLVSIHRPTVPVMRVASPFAHRSHWLVLTHLGLVPILFPLFVPLEVGLVLVGCLGFVAATDLGRIII